MSMVLTLIGAALAVNGLLLFAVSNLNLGVIATALLGMFFLAWGVFYEKIKAFSKKGAGKFIKNAVIVLICAEALFVAFTALYAQNDNVSYNEDALIVLGAAIHGDEITIPLKLRLDKAVEYHSKNPEALIVVTGGQGLQETVTEASAMEKYLVEHGVKKENIIKEEKATSTKENMKFSKQILADYLGDEYEVAVVTNNFHIYRSVAYAKIEGFESVTHLHAGLQWYNLVPCYLRESLAVIKMWLVEFLG